MAFPIVAAALGLATAGAGYLLYERATRKTAMPSSPSQFNPAAPTAPVAELAKGFGYSVEAVFDVKKIPGDQAGFNADNAANYISVTFGQLGFQVLTTPQVLSSDEMKKFLAGQPSTWVFMAKWLKDDKAVKGGDPAILNAAFRPIPAAV